MKPSLSLRMSQHLALTPQLQQSIRLLQLSTLELAQEVSQMLDDNPFLELAEEGSVLPGTETALDTPVSLSERLTEAASEFEGAHLAASPADASIGTDSVFDGVLDGPEPLQEALSGVADNWEGDGSIDLSPDDAEWGGDAGASLADAGHHASNAHNTSDSAADAIELARSQGTLAEHLHRQALSLRLSPLDRAALDYLIDSLNEDGYLEDSLPDLALALTGPDAPEQNEELQEHLSVALRLLQSLEPVGVGARDLCECLRLQCQDLLHQHAHDAVLPVALRLCEPTALALLAKRDVKRLVALTGEPEALVRSAMQRIARLEPKPGRAFVPTHQNIVVPDVLVTLVPRSRSPQFRVQLNPDVMPKLRVHDIYANALRGSKGEAAQGLQQRLQEARWFIKNIQQRFDTILRVASAIVDRQKHFFLHGDLAMRPLVLRDIADELGMHESTISRVTTAKYMATPQGTFELKYFFGSGLDTDSGAAASSTAVRALIRQFVAAENPAKPLSDNTLSDMLKEQGIECARRTVAKYREALKIAPAHMRKTL